MSDNDSDKPDAPKGSVPPPIIRLDASRRDERSTDAINAQKFVIRESIENTKSTQTPRTKPPEKPKE